VAGARLRFITAPKRSTGRDLHRYSNEATKLNLGLNLPSLGQNYDQLRLAPTVPYLVPIFADAGHGFWLVSNRLEYKKLIMSDYAKCLASPAAAAHRRATETLEDGKITLR